VLVFTMTLMAAKICAKGRQAQCDRRRAGGRRRRIAGRVIRQHAAARTQNIFPCTLGSDNVKDGRQNAGRISGRQRRYRAKRISNGVAKNIIALITWTAAAGRRRWKKRKRTVLVKRAMANAGK